MKTLKKDKWGYLFLIPWFLFFVVFTVFPFIFGVGTSFTDFTFNSANFVGLDNYKDILTDDTFRKSVIATLLFAVIVIPGNIVISIWVAKTIHERTARFNAFVKAAFYIPAIVSQVALVIVWKYIFGPTFGLMSSLFTMAGLDPISWFDTSSISIPLMSLFVITVGLGQPIILYSAAMGNIPETYYEAAELDGATKNQAFFKITLPLLKSTTTFVLITTTIAVLQVFVIPYLLTGGGPNNATSTILLMVYKSAFMYGKLGYASAVGVIFFIITAIIAAIQFRVMRSETIEY